MSKLHRNSPDAPESDSSGVIVYTIEDVSQRMGLSRRTVTRIFEHEPGVIILKRPERMHKRGYRSIRIPRAVYERVMRRLTVS